MAKDIWRPWNSPFVPDSIDDRYCAQRPGVAKLIRNLDTEDPSFAATCDVLLEMRKAGVDLDEPTVEIAVKLGRQRYEREKNARRPGAVTAGLPLRLWPEERGDSSIVYYVRRSQLIKIGTTIKPEQRFRDLVPDEILAWEPGGRHEESYRHQQFAHLRQGGEYFRPARDLIAHCKTIRQTHGDPDPRWRTGECLSAIRPASSRIALPPPSSPNLVTASQAASILGISRSTVASWVRRKLLVAVDGRTRPLYYLDHVRALDDRRRLAQSPGVDDTGAP